MTLEETTTGMPGEINDVDALSNGTDSNTEVNGTDQNIWRFINNRGPAYWYFNVITVVLGLAGNFMIFPLMGGVKFSSLSFPVYLRFLAFSDCPVLMVFCIKESLRYFQSSFLIGSNLAVCTLTKFIKYTTTMLSPWLVVGLTLDRFYCVVFPLKRDRICTRRKATIVCSCLTGFSVVISLPLLNGVKTVPGSQICFIKDYLVSYSTFIRIVLTANLPCLLILVLNIVIGIHIQRSVTFRKRFTSTSSGSTENKLDKSLLPLLLISIMAFVTLIPSSIADSVVLILLVTKSDFKTLAFIFKLWPVFNILYLMNFGQIFYILMASSANYRNIIKTKLKCQNVNGRKNNATVSRTPGQVSTNRALDNLYNTVRHQLPPLPGYCQLNIKFKVNLYYNT
ncbi:lysophosphatidic acid receptor 6-like [Gigantopelta aegis]|uniref:lysophosphatidic acid receptor 6-like n=1 Tax=Gigantopelta aegis TaxID=1735272 RepID=UPI001B88C436|nr:lysophosphatidic acid receptor 6-like [Gigantopelta aegis]